MALDNISLSHRRFDSEEEIWAAARYNAAGGGTIGVDEAILQATAWFYRNRPMMSFEQIVDDVLQRVQAIKSRDAPRETWDWSQERREIADKLRRYEQRLKKQDEAQVSWRRGPGTRTEARAQLQAQHAQMSALEYGISMNKSGAKWDEESRRRLMEKMNLEHAVVPIGGSVRYLHAATTQDGQPELRFLRESDMKTLYEAVRVSGR